MGWKDLPVGAKGKPLVGSCDVSMWSGMASGVVVVMFFCLLLGGVLPWWKTRSVLAPEKKWKIKSG